MTVICTTHTCTCTVSTIEKGLRQGYVLLSSLLETTITKVYMRHTRNDYVSSFCTCTCIYVGSKYFCVRKLARFSNAWRAWHSSWPDISKLQPSCRRQWNVRHDRHNASTQKRYLIWKHALSSASFQLSPLVYFFHRFNTPPKIVTVIQQPSTAVHLLAWNPIWDFGEGKVSGKVRFCSIVKHLVYCNY